MNKQSLTFNRLQFNEFDILMGIADRMSLTLQSFKVDDEKDLSLTLVGYEDDLLKFNRYLNQI